MIKKFLSKYAWLVVLVLFALAKFLPFIFKNQVPIPFDIFLGAYYPWLSDKWGYAISVPVKNPILSDVVSQIYPWISLARDQILSGHFPLWNPTSLFGYPFLANYQLGIFYPTSFILLIGNLAQARTIQILVQQLLGLVFMYLYCRHKKASQVASIIGAMIFSTAGLMTTDFEFGLGSRGLIWLPLLLLTIDQYETTKKCRFGLIVALSEFAIITAGQFQVVVYANLILAAIIIPRFIKNPRQTFFLILFILAGFLLSSAQIFPTAEVFIQSIRANDPYIRQVGYGILPLKHLLTTFIAPDLFGNSATGNYFGFWNYRESIGYIGIIGSLLVYLSFLKKENLPEKIGLFICLLFAFTSPLSRLPYLIGIPLLKTAGASRTLYPLIFFASYLAAVGSDFVFSKKIKIKQLLIPTLILSIILDYYFFSYLGYALSPFKSTAGDLLTHATTNFRNLFIPSIVFGLGVVLIVLSQSWLQKWKMVIKLIFIILLSFDLLRFHYKFNPFINHSFAYPQTAVINYLLAHPGRFITTSSEILPSNSWTPYHLESILGYETLFPSRIGGYFATMNSGIPTVSNSERYLDTIKNYDSPLLDLAGVKYIVTLNRDKIRKIDPNGYLRDDSINLKKYSPVFNDRATVILENKSLVGNAYLNYSPIIANDDFDTLAKMVANKENNAAYTPDKLTLNYDSNLSPQIINIKQNLSGDISVDFVSKANGLLTIATTNFPGWHAVLDGKQAKIIKSNFLFIGIEIPPGNHSLRLTYRPTSFAYGMIVSTLTLAVLIVITLISVLSSRKAR